MTISGTFQCKKGEFILDVACDLSSDHITAITGPSGSGKTTLLRCIAGLERAEKGYLSVKDICLQDSAAGVFFPPHKRLVGVVFQETYLFSHLSVMQNIQYGMKRIPKTHRRIQLEEVVEWLGLSPLLTRSTADLSGGEKARVAIARALLTSPDLLLMDEPVSALDKQARSEILSYLQAIQKQCAMPILYVTHSLEEVALLADDMIYLENGKVKTVGSVKDVLSSLVFPYAHHDDASTIIEAVVKQHDDMYALTELECANHIIYVPKQALQKGKQVRVQIHARDVSIARVLPTDTSILNSIPVTVEEVVEAKGHEGQCLVRLKTGQEHIIARITKKSVQALDVDKGLSCYAQIKTVALID